jgi:hypothetical protein
MLKGLHLRAPLAVMGARGLRGPDVGLKTPGKGSPDASPAGRRAGLLNGGPTDGRRRTSSGAIAARARHGRRSAGPRRKWYCPRSASDATQRSQRKVKEKHDRSFF